MDNNKNRQTRNRQRMYCKGYLNDIIKVLLTCGILSYHGLHMLDGSHNIYSRKLKDLRAEGITLQTKFGTKRIEKLNHFEKHYEKYINQLPLGYYGYYQKYGKRNEKYIANKYTKLSTDQMVNATRAYRYSEIVMMMVGSKISVFLEDKPSLKKENMNLKKGNYYYSSIEIKESSGFQQIEKKDETVMIGTRAMGCIIGKQNDYIVYHTGSELLKWRGTTEGQFARTCTKIIRLKCNWREVQGQVASCIVVADKMNIFKGMFLEESVKRNYLNVTLSIYSEMYIIPYTTEGKQFLSYMCTDNWKETLKEKYLKNINTNTEHDNIVCDGFDGTTKYLLFCIPDALRLKKFVKSAGWFDENIMYTIICYDYQEELVREVVGKRDIIEIQTVIFDFL